MRGKLIRGGAWPLLLLSMAFAVLAALSIPGGTSAKVGDEDPRAVLEAFAAAISANDGAAAGTHFAENAVFLEFASDSSFGIFGRPALEAAFSDVEDITVTVTNIVVSGDHVTATARLTDANSAAAGVERFLESIDATIEDGLITELTATYIEGDAQTSTYLEYLRSQEGEDEGPPEGTTIIPLGPGRDGSQEGSLFLFEGGPGVTGVGIEIEDGPDGVLQPAHLHDGDCPGVGAVASPLASVLGGFSFSFISVGLDEILAGNYAVNVHQSAEEVAVYVSCGEVQAAGAEPTPAPSSPVVPPPATPRPGIVAPSTGSGPKDGSAAFGWLTLVLAGAAAATGAAGLALRRKAR